MRNRRATSRAVPEPVRLRRRKPGFPGDYAAWLAGEENFESVRDILLDQTTLERGWPDRLGMRIRHGGDCVQVETLLHGRHHAGNGLAAVATACSLGIYYDGQLAGYSWAGLQRLPIPGSFGQALFGLDSNEAYLFDIYMAPPYRGMRLAGLLRSALQHDLARLGRRRFYSITLAFNRSSRRFKSRLGAREHELRIYVHLQAGSLAGLDLRLRRRKPHLKSPRLQRVLPAAKETSDA